MDHGKEDDIDILKLGRCVLMVAIGLACLIGNALVLRTLFCFKYPKIPMYVAIGGLAVADILRAAFEVPQYLIIWLSSGEFITNAWCKAQHYLISTSMYVAASHLVGLSIIRCILLNDRVHSRSYVTHAFVGSLIIWGVTLLTNIPNILTSSKDVDVHECVEKDSGIGESDERNMWLRILFSYILPIIVIVIVYFITHYFSKKFFEDSYSRRERRLSRMVTVLIAIWAICKLPYEILEVIMFYKSRKADEALKKFITTEDNYDSIFTNYLLLFKIKRNLECLALLDLALRPIIYAKLSYYFSKSFDEVINCTSCREETRRETRTSVMRGVNYEHKDGDAPPITPLTEFTDDPNEENDDCGVHDDDNDPNEDAIVVIS